MAIDWLMAIEKLTMTDSNLVTSLKKVMDLNSLTNSLIEKLIMMMRGLEKERHLNLMTKKCLMTDLTKAINLEKHWP